MLTLAWFLRTQVKPREFSLLNYLSTDAVFLQTCPSDLLVNHDCGSTACALGYCPIVFPRWWGWVRDCGGWQLTLHGTDLGRTVLHEQSVVSQFFGITPAQACQLFYDIVERTPKQQAREMETVADSYGYVYAGEPE